MATNDKCYFDPTTNFTSPNPGEDELATLKRILSSVSGSGVPGEYNYANGNPLTDGGSNLFYGNDTLLADSIGNLFYGNGNGSVLADAGSNLFYGNGSVLADANGNLYFAGPTGDPGIFGQIYQDPVTHALFVSQG